MTRPRVTWRQCASTTPAPSTSPAVMTAAIPYFTAEPPRPPKWHILKDGVEVGTVSYDSEAVVQCQQLHESEPTACLELRDASTGQTRPWHPDYPRGRSLGLWEDLIRQYEPFQQILQFVRESTGKEAILAGGCIRDFMVFESPDKIKDFDCFLLDTAEAEDAPLADKLRLAVQQAGGRWRQALWIRQYHDITQFNRFCVEVELPFAPAGKPVQIITSLGTSPEEVVDHFDWRACMFWYDGGSIGTAGMPDFCNNRLSLHHAKDKELKRVLRRGFYLEEKLRASPLPLDLTEGTILLVASMMTLDPLREGWVDTLSEFE